MTTLIQQETFAAPLPDKVARNDDEVSTVSGSSSNPLSLPCSPSKVWPATPGENPVETAILNDAATLADLPSIGSIGHFAGQCSRCCFFPKGRCQNGYDCRFCHFDHDKRQRKKTRPLFSLPSQSYCERTQALPATMEHAIPPCTPPGLEAHIAEPTMHSGMMQGSFPGASYAISPGLA